MVILSIDLIIQVTIKLGIEKKTKKIEFGGSQLPPKLMKWTFFVPFLTLQ